MPAPMQSVWGHSTDHIGAITMKEAFKNRIRQRGFSLIELSIALVVMGMLASTGAYYAKRTMQTSLHTAQAQQMVSVNNGVQTYAVKNYKAIVLGSAVAGFANPKKPTIAELQAAKYLGPGFTANGILGGAYNITLSCLPAACSATSDIATVVYMTNPIYKSGTTSVDEDGASEVVQKIGADGAYSHSTANDHFVGFGGVDWGAATNPTNKTAVVAIRGGYGSSGWGQFLRLDGSTPMAGTLDMGSNNIGNTATVSATNVVTAAGNGVQVGSSYYYGDSTNSAIRQNGALFVQNLAGSGFAQINAGTVNSAGEVYAAGWFRTTGDSGWYSEKWNGGWYMSDGSWVRSYADKNVYTGGQVQAGSLQSNGRLNANEYIAVGGVAVAGWGCSPNGLIGQDGTGKPLFCQSGVWAGASASTPQSLGVNGWKQLEGGLILQWGQSGWACVNFPRPFTSQVFMVQTEITSCCFHETSVSSQNVNGFCPGTNGNTSNFQWWAVGI